MSNFIINPYRFVEGCPTCWEVNQGGDHGMDDTNMATCQRMDAGSCVIGKTISNISMWLKSGSGSSGTVYGVLFASDYETVVTTFGSIDASTIGTSFSKFTFDSASTSGTVAGAGQFLGIWYDNAGGGTLDVRIDATAAITNQTCCTGYKGSVVTNAGNSFNWCYEEA